MVIKKKIGKHLQVNHNLFQPVQNSYVSIQNCLDQLSKLPIQLKEDINYLMLLKKKKSILHSGEECVMLLVMWSSSRIEVE